MHIFIGSDHGGFEQKNLLIQKLEENGLLVSDCGTYSPESTDYPDFAVAVGRAILTHPRARGILLCRSGEGMVMAANKLPGIRAALAWRKEVAEETRRDNDANILVLPSDYISDDEAIAVVHSFVTTAFSGEERHVRRLEKLQSIERMTDES